MGVFLSILQGVLLIILAIVAFFIAQIVYGMGQGMLQAATGMLRSLPKTVRWIILLPVWGIATFVLITIFNVIFWIGDLFGESLVGTIWTWAVSFIQAIVIPSTIVTTVSMIAPAGRRLVAIVVMIVIWATLVGLLIDPDTGELSGADVEWWFYAWLIVAAGAAVAAVMKVWAIEPLMQFVETGGGILGAESPTYCQGCGAESNPSDHFCPNCGTTLQN